MVNEDVEGAALEAAEGTGEERRRRRIEVLVNKHPVQVKGHEQTGLSIKEAAIAQGVRIRLDFVLFDLDRNEGRIVGNSDPVKVHEGSRFRAIANDDDS